MTTRIPQKAFVLAAGRGERMRPLTDDRPKPMIEVGGITMLDRTLDALAAAGVTEAVVNVHYLGEVIEAHLTSRTAPRITISREEELLDTGGGVKKMIEFFGDDPFYVLNADVVWTDGPSQPALERLAALWNDETMDVLILAHPSRDLPPYMGKGDYYLPGDDTRPVFAKSGSGVEANVIFAGPRIAHPRLFAGAPDGAFSFLKLFHKAEAAGRLHALRHDGGWYHVGTPEAVEATNKILAARPRRAAP